MKRKIRSTANIYGGKAKLNTSFQPRITAKYNGKPVGTFYVNRWGISAARSYGKTYACVPWRKLIDVIDAYNGRANENQV